jgi:16S rRNA (guanine527-N7)-methyltransferase
MPGGTSSSAPPDLDAVFEEARRLGFLGPGPAADQIAHAVSFAQILEAEGAGPAPFLDLGSGGGVPGLVLADRWTAVRAVLLDASQRRTAFLRRTVAALGWTARVVVLEGRAEALARDPQLRGAFPLVVARSFAPPGVTAEIGGAFLAAGGKLAVSEPEPPVGGAPADRNRAEVVPERWPADGLAMLGLAPATIHGGTGARAALMRRAGPVPDRWPRGVGIPGKRPVW